MKQNLRQDLQAIQTELMRGRFEAGLTLCRRVLMYAPREPNVLYMMGVAAAQLGDGKTTKAAFSAAYSLTPDKVDLLLNYGNFLRETGELKEARNLLERAAKLAPHLPMVWKSLSTTLFKLELFTASLSSAEKLTELEFGDESAWELAAGAAQRLGDLERAAELIEKGLRHLPQSSKLHYAFGQIHRERADFEKANLAYEKARALGFSSADLYRNNAEALLELGRPSDAAQFARQGLQKFSTDILLHQVATRLHVESNSPGDAVGDLISAARTHKTNSALWETAISFLKFLDRPDDEQQILAEALRSGCPLTAGLMSLDAMSLGNQGRSQEMVVAYETLLKTFPNDIGIKFDFAIQLLKAREPRRADDLLIDVLKVDPFDQLALAFRSSALRLLDDDEYFRLVDHDEMVFEVKVPVPNGYSSTGAYFHEVSTVLEALHHTHAHPIDQSVRGGTQTNGFLFRIAHPVVKQLEQQIRLAVVEALQKFHNDSRHPFWGRNIAGTRAADVLFSGAWSVRLKGQGYHTNHVHPKGWISSALYIAVPDAVADATDKSGHIQFGAPEEKLGLDLPAVRTIKPEIGTLVLFPSYMWHGTVPFSASQSRITVAFDLIPHQ